MLSFIIYRKPMSILEMVFIINLKNTLIVFEFTNQRLIIINIRNNKR